ncbi:MAG: sigma 54-interacting transcriptional regulator [Pseudomonadota bacterium]
MKDIPKALITGLIKSPLSFSCVFDEIPVGIAILDRDCHIVNLNRAFEALTGFSLNSAYGVPCRYIVRSRACLSGCPARSLTTGTGPVSLETDIINTDRQRLPVRMTVAPMLGAHGEITGYIETLEDIRVIQQCTVKKNKAYSFGDIIGRSPQMEKIFQTLPLLAQSDASILITGETGTGKDLVAEAIHQTSHRASGPFIKINCGALPETLLESEIFGHQKGAFTGAVENKPGRFQLAHNGTIFLTEIGDLPISLQVKLLTFLDDKVIYPLGSTKGFNANVRIVAATHRNLEQMVREGRFRQDLFFRLNVARIHLPPLKHREGDIRLLLDHFLNALSRQLNKRNIRFSPRTLDFLLHFNYTGNIRELRNIVEYAVNVAGEGPIELEHLPAYIFDPAPDVPNFVLVAGETHDTRTRIPESESNASVKTWASTEREMILETLIKARGKKNVAADSLGWGRSTLWRKMKQYGIDQ